MIEGAPLSPFVKQLIRMFTDYLLPNENTTLDYECMQEVTNALPVTLTDMDEVVIIPLFNMRSGIDQDTFHI